MRPGLYLAVLLALSPLALHAADPVAEAIATTINSNQASAESQQRINAVDDSAQSMLQRYRTASWQSQQLGVYAQQLQALLASQEAEKVSLRQQAIELERTERELTPLMLRMLDSLGKFITLDLPFLKQERRERLENLKRAMADPEVAIAERYRRILEAYQVEIDYGRSLGVERAQINLDGVDGREVDVLRVGRVALFYLTLDSSQAGRWNADARKWEPLDKRYRVSVKKGLRVAREIAAPDVLVLPMAAAGAAK